MSAPVKNKREIVAAYAYKDEEGRLLYEKVRWGPDKEFSIRQPNPDYDPTQSSGMETNKPWLWNARGVRWVLYRMPQIIDARRQQPKRMIFIVEGEGVANEVVHDGMEATTNGAALMWHQVDDRAKQCLKGANVCVLPDNDPFDSNLGFSVGMKHAEEVCDDLMKIAASVRMITLPGLPKRGDYVDWKRESVARGEGAGDRQSFLRKLVNDTPIWQGKAAPKVVNKPAPVVPTKPNLVAKSALYIGDVMDELQRQSLQVNSTLEVIARSQAYLNAALNDATAGKDCGFNLTRSAAVIALGLETLPEFKSMVEVPSGD